MAEVEEKKSTTTRHFKLLRSQQKKNQLYNFNVRFSDLPSANNNSRLFVNYWTKEN